MSKTYLNSSLTACFGKVSPEQATFTQLARNALNSPGGNFFQVYRQSHLVTLAQHRSHSSHLSHRSGYSSGGHYSHSSHASHRSSDGGYDTPAPDPVYSTPVPANTPPSPSTSDTALSSQPLLGANSAESSSTSTGSLPSLSGRTKKFERIVTLVQIGLMGQGLYIGPLNGSVGPMTRSALRKFQQSHGLAVTGTITPETLDALKVPSGSD